MVRAVGIEPTLCHQNWILSPARLPVPPRPLIVTEDGNYLQLIDQEQARDLLRFTEPSRTF
jgi:hypothetical protein